MQLSHTPPGALKHTPARWRYDALHLDFLAGRLGGVFLLGTFKGIFVYRFRVSRVHRSLSLKS